MARRGYWGDIVNSPFVSIGTESDNKELFKKANGKHVKVRQPKAHIVSLDCQVCCHTNPLPFTPPSFPLPSFPSPSPLSFPLPLLQTSLNIAEHNLLQWLQLSFPISIPEGVLSQKTTDSEGAKLVEVEEEKGEVGSGDSSCTQGSSRAAVGNPDRDRPLLPGVH